MNMKEAMKYIEEADFIEDERGCINCGAKAPIHAVWHSCKDCMEDSAIRYIAEEERIAAIMYNTDA